MADLQRLESRQVTAPIDANIVPSGNLQNQVAAQGANQMAVSAQTMADQFVTILGEEEKEKGRREAGQIIQRDGNNDLIPPSSFTPPGFQSRAYAQTYKEQAVALYSNAQEMDYTTHLEGLRIKYPNDPIAFKEESTKKKELMLRNLDPNLMPYAQQRLNSIETQGISIVTNNRAVEDNKVINEKAELAAQAIISESSKTAASLYGSSPETIAANGLLNQQRVNEFVTIAEMAKWTPNKIAMTLEKIKIETIIMGGAKHLEKLGYAVNNEKNNPAGAVYDPASVVATREAAAKYAEQWPEYSEKIKAGLYAGINAGIIRQQAIIGGIEAREVIKTRDFEVNLQKEKILREGRGNDPFFSPTSDLEYKSDLQQRRQKILIDPTISDSTKLKMVGSIDRVEGVVSESYAKEVQSQLLSHGAVISSKTATNDQVAYADMNISKILQSPQARSVMTPQMESYAVGVQARAAERHVTGNIASTMFQMEQGNMPPDNMRTVYRGWIDQGLVGEGKLMTFPQMMESFARAEKSYNQKSAKATSISVGQKNWQLNGQPPNEEQLAAVHAENTLSSDLGNRPFDGLNQEDRNIAVQRAGMYGGVDPEVRKWVNDSYGKNADPNTILAARELYSGIRQTLSNGPHGHFYTENMSHVLTQKWLGEKGPLILAGWNIEASKAASATVGVSPSQSGHAGGPPDKISSDLNTSLNEVMSEVQSFSNTAGWRRFLGLNAGDPKRIGENSGPAQSVLSPLLDAAGLTSGIRDFVGAEGSSSIVLDPELRSRFLKSAQTKLELKGKVYADMGFDKNKTVLSETMLEFRDHLELANDPNVPGQKILRPKTGASIIAGMLGSSSPVSGKTESDFVEGFWRALGNNDPTMERFTDGSGRMVTSFNQYGAPSILLYGILEGSPRLIREMDVNDPLLKAYGSVIAEEVSKNLSVKTAPPSKDPIKDFGSAVGYAASGAWYAMNAIPKVLVRPLLKGNETEAQIAAMAGKELLGGGGEDGAGASRVNTAQAAAREALDKADPLRMQKRLEEEKKKQERMSLQRRIAGIAAAAYDQYPGDTREAQ